MTPAEAFLKSLDGGRVWEDACEEGKDLAASLTGSCSEAIDAVLTTRGGCNHLRWLARRVFGKAADQAIERAVATHTVLEKETATVDGAAAYAHAITREVAEMLRERAAAWEAAR